MTRAPHRLFPVLSPRLALGLAAVVVVSLMTVLSGPAGASAPAPAPAPRERQAARGSFVVWDTTAIYPTLDKISAHGKIPGGKRKVAMQVKVKRSWQTIGNTRTNGKGKFRIRGKLDWYGAHKVRIIAPGRRPFIRSKKVRVAPPYFPIGHKKDYKLIHGSSVRKNYRFNPCQRINYRVNDSDIGREGRVLVKQALGQVTWATGIKFHYVGKSKAIPYNMKPRKRYPRGTDLIIGWATHAEVPDFVRRTAAGFGGPRWIFPARNFKGQRVWRTDEAEVTLSTDYWYDGFAHSFFDSTRATMGELILHEVGHALGLDHVPTAPMEIMNGRGYYQYPDTYYKGLYNLGDLNGLSKVGLKQGCLRPVGRGGRVTGFPSEVLPLP